MSFDPTDFLNATTTESNDTKIIPCPATDEGFLAVSDKVDCIPWQGKDDPSKSGLRLEVTWTINDHNVLSLCGRDKVTVKQSIMLDLSDSGGLDMSSGKNVGLGKLREALNLNIPGQPFAPSMLSGRMAKVCVKHEAHKDDIFAKVYKVLAC